MSKKNDEAQNVEKGYIETQNVENKCRKVRQNCISGFLSKKD